MKGVKWDGSCGNHYTGEGFGVKYLSTLGLLLALQLLPAEARSELRLCNGVWTNKECKTAVKTNDALKKRPLGGNQEREKKQAVVEEAMRLQQEMLAKGINFPAQLVESYCYRAEPPVSPEDCEANFRRHKENVEAELRIRELRAQ